VTATNGAILFYECQNRFQVQTKRTLSELSVESNDAIILPDSSQKMGIVIVPKNPSTTIQMDLEEGAVFQQTFEVIRPPKPQIELIVNGKAYDGVSTISKKSNLLVRVKPDPAFLAAFPEDAIYLIDHIDLVAQRSLGPPTKVATFSGKGQSPTKGIPITLGNYLKADPPGTTIFLRIGSINRVNFRHEIIREGFSSRELALGLTIK
ncbi:MAG: hypothetical protein AAFV80_24190, partial [Bacteroidota bacterium]